MRIMKWVLCSLVIMAMGLCFSPIGRAEESAPPAAEGAAGDMEPLKIELPEPYYGATPLNYFGPNLERTYKKRPPFPAPKGTTNVAKGKPVTSSTATPTMGKLAMIVDGDKRYVVEESVVQLDSGVQYVQIDLGAPYEIHAVVFWHFHAEERVYFDTIVRVSNDPQFKEGATTLFNNDHDNSSGLGKGTNKEYIENYEGKLVPGNGVQARYVRLYSKGNTTDDMNHYIEVEVYAKPVGEGQASAPASQS